MHDHYTVLGLARVRTAWFSQVSRWATAGQLPIQFVKCVSADEVRARLQAGRALSALLIDSGLEALDRDLVDLARTHGCAVFVVDDGHHRQDWAALGVAAVLSDPVEPASLLAALVERASPVVDVGDTFDATGVDGTPTAWQGRLVAVTGGGGTGRTTVAMAVAQGLAGDPRLGGHVALVDAALHADLAMLHDVGDVVPGVQELVEAHRLGRPTEEDVRGLLFHLPDRGYDLLLGLRRHRDWAALRPRAFGAGLQSLTQAYAAVVADVDADVEGDDEVGSVEVEDRNVMARTIMAGADVVLVTGRAGVVGIHRLAQILDELGRFGVPADRLLPVLVGAARSPRARAELTRALAALRRVEEATGAPSPIFVPERRQIEAIVRGADALPRSFVAPIAAAAQALLEQRPRRSAPEPVAVVPGSMGSWSADVATG